MHLWNEYEGRTIADIFPLDKLLLSEGRSAFFSTSNGTGIPTVIRIIEAHFDEAEILNRWQIVSSIHQDNLLNLKKFGQTVLDGQPLLYAVMEPTETNLAEILQERPLTTEETHQVATSLVPALQALHSHGLIHEHVFPANILASGEVIKLRSDCIREAPEGPEGDHLRSRDVHDLAVVILECLTQRSTLHTDVIQLPAPFDEIIRNGISGSWGLPQIATALTPSRQQPRPPAPVATPPQPKPQPTPAPIQTAPTTPRWTPPPDRIVNPTTSTPRRGAIWFAGAIAFLLLIFISYHYLHQSPTPQPATTSQTAPASSNPSQPAPVAVKPSPIKSTAGTPKTLSSPKPNPTQTQQSLQGRTAWRVVAYTYNREDQAQKKVESLTQHYAALNPEVFTPSGHAPFLVTLGGAMTHDQAIALKQKAQAAGLPQDIYAQNYSH